MTTCSFCKQEFVPHKLHPHAKRCSSKICKQAYKNQWGRNNPECKKAWVERNPEKRALASDEYRKRNASYYREYSNLRSRHERRAKPPNMSEWNEFLIQEIFHLAYLKGLEVDHIVPIKHDKVCGLHVPWNLQLLTRSENARKSNKLPADEDLVAKVEQ